MNAGVVTTDTRYYYRRLKNHAVTAITFGATAITLVPLFLILGYLVAKGASSVNLAFFIHLPKPVGVDGGGMANAIVGTLTLVAFACLIGIPVGLGAGIYLSENRDTALSHAVRFAADTLTGVPSIVIGIFAYAIIVRPMHSFSAMAGGFALGVIMIPLVTRTTEEIVLLVPHELREAAYALGVTRWRTTLLVVVRSAAGGIATGVILAIARVAGETAPLLFTAFGNRFWSRGFRQPIASLPAQVYTYAISPFEDWHRQAWAGALVLTVIVLTLEIGVRWVSRQGTAQGRA
jgi:phosphate transport system permease protein